MRAHELSLKYNIFNHVNFKEFASKLLPSKSKYPLTHQTLQIVASHYFDTFFKPNGDFYPLAKPTILYNRKLVNDILYVTNFNFFISLFAYILKLIFCQILKNQFIIINFPICNIITKDSYKEDLFIKVNIFSYKKNFYFKNINIFSKIIKKLSTSTISPLSVVILKCLSIPLRINLNNVYYLSKLNPKVLRLLEASFKHDLEITTSFLSNLNIKEFKHNGWFSIKGSILFTALSNLDIYSNVISHGHVGHTSLAYFYPIKPTKFSTFTEEEALRIEGLMEYLEGPSKKIDFLVPLNEFEREGLNDPFSTNPNNIIIALSTPEILQVTEKRLKYEYFIRTLQGFKFNVFYRPHHRVITPELDILSLNKTLPCYKESLSLLNKDKTIILGSCTTLLLDAFNLGMKSFEISDFANNISSMVKSLPSYTIEKFLSLALDRKHKIRKSSF